MDFAKDTLCEVVVMSMIFIKGAPGSGKSYWAAYKLMRDERVRGEYVVVHNIKDLNANVVGHEFLYTYDEWGEGLKKDGSNWERVLNQDVWEGRVECIKRMTGRSLLLIIDEAGDGLDVLRARIKRFFSWHRHMGIDIWLIAQDRDNILRQYRNLCEYVITGNKSYVIDYFIYTYSIGRSKFRTEKLSKDEAVFGSYKSFDVEGVSGRKSWLVKFLVLLMVLGMGLLWWGMRSVRGLVGNKGEVGKIHDGGSRRVKGEKDKGVVKHKSFEVDDVTLVTVVSGKVYVQDKDGIVKDLMLVLGGYNVANVENGVVTVLTGEGVKCVRWRMGIVKGLQVEGLKKKEKEGKVR